MTFQVRRYPSRGRWWSVVAYLALLSSSKAIAQGRRSLEADDDEFIRQVSANETEADDTIEDRMLPTEMESEVKSIASVLAPFHQKMAEAIPIKPVNPGHEMDNNDIITMLMSKSDEIEVRGILRDVKGVIKNGEALAVAQLEYWAKKGVTAEGILLKMLKPDGKGRNIFTDSSLLRTWSTYARRKFERQHPNEVTFNLLIRQYDLKPVAEFVLTKVEDETIGSLHYLFKLEWNYFLKKSKMTPDDLYARLKLNEDPGPLVDPVMLIWFDYAKEKGMKDLDEWLFKQVIGLYHGRDPALLHAMANAETPLSALVVGKVIDKWLAEGVTTEKIDELLEKDEKLTTHSRDTFKDLWEWYYADF